MSGFMYTINGFLYCIFSEIQATNGNNTIQPLHDSANDKQPNTVCLFNNQAYGTQLEEASHNLSTDREYEVILPLMREKSRVDNTEDNLKDDGKNISNVQTGQSNILPHRYVSPGQPGEVVECSLTRNLTENGDQQDLNDNGNIYHTLEPKVGDIEDKAGPYEVPLATLMKTKSQ